MSIHQFAGSITSLATKLRLVMAMSPCTTRSRGPDLQHKSQVIASGTRTHEVLEIGLGEKPSLRRTATRTRALWVFQAPTWVKKRLGIF